MRRHAYAGQVASKGAAAGVLRRDRPVRAAPARPAASVVGAVAATLQQLVALQASSQELGREILEFQVELLEDDSFVSELIVRSGDTRDPQAAIGEVFEEQIELFASSESELFAARAADMIDLRDRLLGCFGGDREPEVDWSENSVLLADDMTPSRFLEIDWKNARGIALRAGSAGSHVALLARAQGVPMLVRIGDVDPSMLECPALLDAVAGRLIVNPEAAELGASETPIHTVKLAEDVALGPALLPDGAQVKINLSLNSLASLDETPAEWFDGIGLVRTELLLPDPAALLQQEVQANIYRRLFDWAGDRPVTIRLIDAGGDKAIPGFTIPGETNAFLGVRGARLLARRPDVLQTQYAAILEAAAGRPVRILVPMLTLPKEMEFFRRKLDEVIARQGGNAQAMLGMLVETPAAALEIGSFGADFFAIGTNDLVQYTLAVSRDSDALDFGEEIAPAVLDLIRLVLREAERTATEVTLCGDVASSLVQLRQLIDCGIRSIAVPARFAPRFKHFIRHGE